LCHSLLYYLQPHYCPSCNEKGGTIIETKYFITQLIECRNCHLRYRVPVDSDTFNKRFYQADYTEADGTTTGLPTDKILHEWIDSNFKGTGFEAKGHIDIMKLLYQTVNGKRIVDYGASWGYKSYQLNKAGLITDSYEISVPRAIFGKKLGLEIKTDVVQLSTSNDIFYSSHVIEHLPDIPSLFETARRTLAPDGFMITICPNGSETFRKKEPRLYHLVWGLVHPSYITPEYMAWMLKDVSYYIGSSPFNNENLKKWDQKSQVIDDMSGHELLVIAAVNKKMK
jgi:hypothetical protein